jgi:hypothetical protein
MDNFQLENLMAQCSHGHQFKGVYAKDMLPTHLFKNGGYIVNTQNSDQPGQHWCAFYFPRNGIIEYFDPYGIIPLHKEFLDFMDNKEFIYNSVPIQNPRSEACGPYCVFYLCARINGFAFFDIIKHLIDNFSYLNDNFIHSFLRQFNITS